ncbi:RagB/SusD family nutrient uptake outer membrane protein [Rufibacter roseus]|uniref:RagB/SusD family nutrient uptake outer membrane protein n=1 Tax=Rufibacter roseus TaxID=1567108 RepID=A0ABW2DJR0_9BACT|nr:RagB/SusD family nutrient uptake outer membrane protein [Rufibacter roseus]
MKKQFYILFLSAGLSVFSSCSDVLDVEPTTSIEFEGAITDARSADRALQGVYSAFQVEDYYGLSYLYYQGLYADNITFVGTFTTHLEVADRRINPTNLQIANTWAAIYSAIGRANVVIQAVEGLETIDGDEKNRIIGEAKFLRALAYFDLVKVFGGVPIVTTPTLVASEINYGERKSVDEVYSQIVGDLQDAETRLTGFGDVNYPFGASEYAASALLARVYLQRGMNAEARSKANDVITNGPYELAPNYADIFTGTGMSAPTNESIFELAFNRDDPNALATSSNPSTPGQKFYVSTNLYNVFEASGAQGDERFAASVQMQGTRRRIVKYSDVVQSADNVPVIRLAEMYLIRAEANARLGNANLPASLQVISDINAIRERAGLNRIVVGTMTNAQALAEILQQRRLEFAFEGLRFMDLKRYNATCQAPLNFCAPDNNFRNLWPIPYQQFVTNPTLGMQNTGYN